MSETPTADATAKKKGWMEGVWNVTGGLITSLAGQKKKPSPAKPVHSGGKKAFWNKRQTRLPGTVKQVRGAQYPPLTTPGSMPVLKQPEWKQQRGSPAAAPDTANNTKNATAENAGQGGAGGAAAAGQATGEAAAPSGARPLPGAVVTGERKGSEGATKREQPESKADKTQGANALSKRAQIFKLINEPTLDVGALRKRAWSGLCPAVRSDAWQLALGYQPANRARRGPTIAKRRREYKDHCQTYYYKDESRFSTAEHKIMHQIRLDTPRTLPGVKLLQQKAVQGLLERILYIWSVRHPASGYVQGINDLVVPFFVVFLAARIGIDTAELKEEHLADAERLEAVEADCFFCLSKLLDGIQDHYTASQPGIQRMVFKLEELIHRLDEPLHAHLKKYDIRFFHFSYRWMNCLLMREVSLPLIIRVWDTYIAEPDGFKVFHIYVCASMLKRFSPALRALEEFQDLIVYLQNLPTSDWTEKDVETLLAQAYVYKYQFEGAENHLH
mmetsp:Transcript_1215/g.2347  ORF Transcript_1215/g.2347 Transcript_1215/m.2347 type:complete len:501 (-) Transcript_1215:390-1892(-)